MNFIEGDFYHIYNRGNNRQPIFFNDDNYLYFIKKIREQIFTVCDIMAYCLMPNHFHLLIRATKDSIKERNSFGGKPMQELAYRVGVLLSSYSQAINRQQQRVGSLFQQKTKAKLLKEENNDKIISYLEQCFYYIHQNPLAANLVNDLSEWIYSSYLDYAELRKGTLCKKEILFHHTGLHPKDVIAKSNITLDETIVSKLF